MPNGEALPQSDHYQILNLLHYVSPMAILLDRHDKQARALAVLGPQLPHRPLFG
jgi:hypothetical protein